MNEFVTIEYLATFAGLVFATAILVQFTKSIVKNKLGDSFVRLYTFIIALLLTFIFANKGYDLQNILLTVINAVLISISAMGAYESIADPRAEKIKIDNMEAYKEKAIYHKVNYNSELQKKIKEDDALE